MKKTELLLFLLVAFQAGCRAPQTMIQKRENCDPCFSSAVETCETFSIEMVRETGTIEEYVQLGLSRNPQLQESRHKIEALRHRIPQVLSLPDPTVNTNTYLAPVETAAGRQAFALGISQKFTNVERRAIGAAIVTDQVVAAEAELAQIQLEVSEDIRSASYQLLFIRKSIEITKEDAESLAHIAEVIERQYEVKQSVTQQDVLNIQVEQSNVENQQTELVQKEKTYQARLARLLHLDPKSELQILDQLQLQSTEFDVDVLIAQAIQQRPDLQSQFANINRDRKKICLARLETKPDFTVGLNWIATSNSGISPVTNGDDALLLGIGFNLPVYKSRIRAGICEAQANRRASESKLDSLQDKAAEEVFDLVAKLESNRRTLDLVQNDIIPKAQRTLDLSIEEYATDQISYVQLIANWRNVLRYRIAEASLLSQSGQLLASLASSVGEIRPLVSPSGVPEQPSLESFDPVQEQEAEPSTPESESNGDED